MHKPLRPFLKWPGGKRWLAQTIAGFFTVHEKYFEPFLGAGAVFFALRPKRAVLSDTNEELISAFVGVRDDADALMSRLSRMRISKTTFEKIRAESPKMLLARAVRLIYLNRTAFNGIYRVNLNGEFNVPFGCKKGTKLCDSKRIGECSRALRRTVIEAADFRQMLDMVTADDALYVDPPYTVKHDNNGFRRYNERLFSWKDQVDLAAKLSLLAKGGTQIVVSNSSHKEVRALYYRRGFTPIEVERASCMAADANHRGNCRELLLISDSVRETPNSRIDLKRKGALLGRFEPEAT